MMAWGDVQKCPEKKAKDLPSRKKAYFSILWPLIPFDFAPTMRKKEEEGARGHSRIIGPEISCLHRKEQRPPILENKERKRGKGTQTVQWPLSATFKKEKHFIHARLLWIDCHQKRN